MPACQVQSVLNCVRDIHRSLASRFRTLSDAASDEKLMLLYADMADREKRFANVIDEFEETAEDDVLTTWLQFVPDDVVKFARDTPGIKESSSPEEAIEQIQEVNRTLGDAYRELAGETECGHVCELFRNLAELEENNDRHLSKMLLGE